MTKSKKSKTAQKKLLRVRDILARDDLAGELAAVANDKSVKGALIVTVGHDNTISWRAAGLTDLEVSGVFYQLERLLGAIES